MAAAGGDATAPRRQFEGCRPEGPEGANLIRIMLVHGGRLIRQALASVLDREDDMDVGWQLAPGEDVLPEAVQQRPDVIVLDFANSETGAAVDLCEAICGKLPECRVLALVDRRSCTGLLPILTKLTPQVGIIATEDPVTRLVHGVRELVAGEFVLDVELAVAALNAGKNPLTEREKGILRLLVKGEPPTEIARMLHLSTGTVRNYLTRIMTKTDARTRIEAVRRAQEAGWI